MLRKVARQRRDFIYRKALELREAETNEKRAKLREALSSGKPLDSKITNDEKLRNDFRYDESKLDPDNQMEEELDDEYGLLSGVIDPRVVVTTARDPSSRMTAFSKEIRLLLPTSIRLNRGNAILPDLVSAARKSGQTDIVMLSEHRGTPTAMTISHFPHGPTASFTLHNVVMRHEIPESMRGTVSESYPHLIFEGFTTKLGKRVVRMLQHIFPPRDPLTSRAKLGSRVIIFANREDWIEMRHYVYVQTAKEHVELSEVGPRMTMRLFEIRRGTLENKDADAEWQLRQYTRTSKKKTYL